MFAFIVAFPTNIYEICRNIIHYKKRNKHAPTWMDHKNSMLTKINENKRSYNVIKFTWNL